MIPLHKQGLAQLNAVRNLVESRLLTNDDYQALLALDRAISEFCDRSLAKTQAVFERWGVSQRRGSASEDTDSRGA